MLQKKAGINCLNKYLTIIDGKLVCRKNLIDLNTGSRLNMPCRDLRPDRAAELLDKNKTAGNPILHKPRDNSIPQQDPPVFGCTDPEVR